MSMSTGKKNAGFMLQQCIVSWFTMSVMDFDNTVLMPIQAFDNEEIKNYEGERHSLFYTDTQAKQIYKDHVRAIVNRKNHLNG